MHSLFIKPPAAQKLRKGYPWVYAPDIVKSHPTLAPGELVRLLDSNKDPLAIAYFNPNSKLACRVLSHDTKLSINSAFFHQRFAKALAFRQAKFTSPYYRLVHGESDNMPGLVIDRFNDILVCQTNTAGMEMLKPLWLDALQALLNPSKIFFKEDVPVRQKEGLEVHKITTTQAPSIISLVENGVTFYAMPELGQKTGWFFDQRANRRWVSLQAKNKTLLDLYTYNGGFGLTAACQQARHVTLVDSSQKALSLAERAAQVNQVTSQCTFIREDVFALLPKLIEANHTFEVVVADPPAFVKQAHHQGAGLIGYQKLAKLASQVVAPNGILFIASCSHHACVQDFRQAVETGIAKANRQARLIRKAGADSDHPIHPLLPETHYLKTLAFRFD